MDQSFLIDPKGIIMDLQKLALLHDKVMADYEGFTMEHQTIEDLLFSIEDELQEDLQDMDLDYMAGQLNDLYEEMHARKNDLKIITNLVKDALNCLPSRLKP